MTNLEAIVILTRHNAWRRDNETEFPELPDSPALIRDLEEALILLRALVDLQCSVPPLEVFEDWVETNQKIYKFLAELE